MQQLADRPRATRYDMAAEVMYRRVGEEMWHEGRTVNVSRSGVLIDCGSEDVAVETRLEFVLLLPGLGLPGRSRVHCQGHVVRHAEEARSGGRAVAATIDAYELRGVVADPVDGRVVV